MASDTVMLTRNDVAATLEAQGLERVAWGPLQDIGISSNGNGAADASVRAAAKVVVDPARVFRVHTVTRRVAGIGTTTIVAPATDGPYVAVAAEGDAWALVQLDRRDEAVAVLATHLGMSSRAPAAGAAILGPDAWSLLAALVDQPAAQSVGDLEPAFSGEEGTLVDVFRSISPVPVRFPDDPVAAAQRLAIAGVLTERFGSIALTSQGEALVGELARYVVAGFMTVDHRRGVGTARMAALSTIRTVDRLYVGAWSADGDGLRVAIGEPGATSAIATVRALVDAANSTA